MLDERKGAIAERIIRHRFEAGTACISFQVVQECLNDHTVQGRDPAFTAGQTRNHLEAVFEPLFRVSASIPLYQRSLDIQARYRCGIYDA